MNNEINEQSVDDTVKNIYKGLELTVTELQSKLPEQVDGMGAKLSQKGN